MLTHSFGSVQYRSGTGRPPVSHCAKNKPSLSTESLKKRKCSHTLTKTHLWNCFLMEMSAFYIIHQCRGQQCVQESTLSPRIRFSGRILSPYATKIHKNPAVSVLPWITKPVKVHRLSQSRPSAVLKKEPSSRIMIICSRERTCCCQGLLRVHESLRNTLPAFTHTHAVSQ